MNDSRFPFSHQPFPSTPHLDLYVDTGNSELIRKQCIDSIRRGSGPIVILGGAGLGKTMTCLRIKQSLDGISEAVFLSSSQIASRADLLKSLLYELRMPYRGLFDGELRLSLIERLQYRKNNSAEHFVLIVDEAQALSPRLLEELRLLTNISVNGRACLSLILCGSLKLEELLCNPQLESLQQRITARHYLRPLDCQECSEYIRHRVELAGVVIENVFDATALNAIHLVSNGIPRLIDQIADRALAQDSPACKRPINASDIEKVWKSSQQSPLPWVDSVAIPINEIGNASLAVSQERDTDEAVASITKQSRFEPANTTEQSTFVAERLMLHSANSAALEVQTQTPSVNFDYADSDLVGWSPEAFVETDDTQFKGPPPSAGMGLSSVIEEDRTKCVQPSMAMEAELNSFDAAVVTDALRNSFDQEPIAVQGDLAALDAADQAATEEDANSLQGVNGFLDDSQAALTDSVNANAFSSNPFDLQQPIEASARDFEENLFDLISNMNLESISIDPFIDLKSLSEGNSSQTRSLSNDYAQGSKSFFSELEDDNGFIEVENVLLDSISLIEEGLGSSDTLGERLCDLESIASFNRDSALSLSSMKLNDSNLLTDDRDIITVEEDIAFDQDQPRTATTKPVADALIQSYAKIFADLRG